jgi:hypothetical protein
LTTTYKGVFEIYFLHFSYRNKPLGIGSPPRSFHPQKSTIKTVGNFLGNLSSKRQKVVAFKKVEKGKHANMAKETHGRIFPLEGKVNPES